MAPFPLADVPSPVPPLLRRHIVLLAPPWYPVPPRGYGAHEERGSVVDGYERWSLLDGHQRCRRHPMTFGARLRDQAVAR
jgi:hypothetical protein